MEKGPKNIQIALVGYNTPEYQKTLQLRNNLLRVPLGLSFEEDQLKAEAHDYHLAAYFSDFLIGCLVLTPYTDDRIKMRQMAIDYSHQGYGIGKMIVYKAEELAHQLGYTTIFLHARVHVKAFYEKMGYEAMGPYFKEVTLWHIRMEKAISYG